MNENETNTLKMQELEAKIELLTKALSLQSNTSNNSDVDSYIEFESVSMSPVYLSTEGNGQGDIYEFSNFGDVQNIPIVDAREIIRHNKSFISEGVVYIKDENFINKENLKKHYDKIISANEMQNLLLCKRQAFGDRYSKLTDTQKETVQNMLFDKVKNNKKVDDEVLYYIYQSSGKDIKAEAANFQLLINNKED